jgi:hypothetical protein
MGSKSLRRCCTHKGATRESLERARFELAARLFTSYGKFADLGLSTRPPSAIEPSLRFNSLENGNNAEDARRFLALWAEKYQI